MQYSGVDWVALLCGVIGLYLIGNKSRAGFVFGILAQTGWIILGMYSGSGGLVISSCIAVTLYVRAWIKWRPNSTSD